MAKGNAQFIKDIIDDSKKSTNTTYSSDKLESLLGSGNADIVYLTAVSATAPSIVSSTDKYYNTTTKLVYEVANNAWNSGTAPKTNTIYVDKSKDKLYTEKNNALVPVTGSGADISQEPRNAIENKTDGLYVKDLSQEVKNINIAQKTVNELGYKSLLDSPSEIFTLNSSSSTSNGEGTNTILNKTITLNDSIENYNYLKFILEPKNDSKNINWIPSISEIRVSDINYYNSEINTNGGSSTFIIIGGVDTPTAGSSMVGHVTFKCWFKNSTTLFVYRGGLTNTLGIDWSKWRIKDIIGISKEVITIDPVNYIDTTQGIQDTPVGHIVEIMDNKETEHYIQCDGSEKTIGTYPHLEQHFREMGAINMFGGDGITTYKLPNIEPKPFAYVSYLPEMTANNAPVPYVASADSIHSSPYQPYMAFNSKEGDAGYCWHSLSATSHWLQIDYGAPKKINSFKMKGRKSYSQWYGQMPTSFKLQGSNDGTNFVDIKSFSDLSWGSSIEVEFMLDNPVEYRYYKLADMKSSSNFICFNKIEYAYNVKKYTFIKYEPTYFIDTITGYEEIVELLATSKDYVLGGLNNTTVINELVTLKDSIENYDKLEVVGQIIDTNGKVAYIKNESIRVSDLTYNTSNSINECNDLVIATRSTNALFQSDLSFNFKDANTLRIIRIGLYSTATGNTSWQSFRIKSIRGIKNVYKIS